MSQRARESPGWLFVLQLFCRLQTSVSCRQTSDFLFPRYHVTVASLPLSTVSGLGEVVPRLYSRGRQGTQHPADVSGLVLCSGSLFWFFILVLYAGSLFWFSVLVLYAGSLFWFLVSMLVLYDGSCSGSLCCFTVLVFSPDSFLQNQGFLSSLV